MTDASAATDPDKTPASALDESRVGRLLLLGLPIVTISAAAVVGAITNIATALLVLIAGTLLGVIAIFWASIRVLSGDAPLPPELEELDRAAQGVDALSARRTMLVRALKDLENERDLGKLEDSDFDQLSSTYRAELKDVLRRIDATLEPHRVKAEAIARAHLAKVGLAEAPSTGDVSAEESVTAPPEATAAAAERRACPKCKASNEPDAKFCKECATSLLEKTSDEE